MKYKWTILIELFIIIVFITYIMGTNIAYKHTQWKKNTIIIYNKQNLHKNRIQVGYNTVTHRKIMASYLLILQKGLYQSLYDICVLIYELSYMFTQCIVSNIY